MLRIYHDIYSMENVVDILPGQQKDGADEEIIATSSPVSQALDDSTTVYGEDPHRNSSAKVL